MFSFHQLTLKAVTSTRHCALLCHISNHGGIFAPLEPNHSGGCQVPWAAPENSENRSFEHDMNCFNNSIKLQGFGLWILHFFSAVASNWFQKGGLKILDVRSWKHWVRKRHAWCIVFLLAKRTRGCPRPNFAGGLNCSKMFPKKQQLEAYSSLSKIGVPKNPTV